MSLICFLIGLYTFVVIVRIVLGMVIEFGRIPWGHPVRRIGDTFGLAVDPVLRPLRRFIPSLPLGGMSLDLSPLVLIIGLQVLFGILC